MGGSKKTIKDSREAEEEEEMVAKRQRKSVPVSDVSERESEDEEEEKDDKKGEVHTVYVFGFPYETDIDAYVRENVSTLPTAIRVHTWHDSGKSKGCAHLDFASQQIAETSIQELNGKTVGSRYISATLAKEKAVPVVSSSQAQPSKRLFVKNLPYEIKEEDLRTLFSNKFGPVTSVRIPKWNHTQNAKGFAYVEFETLDCAQACMQHHEKKPLKVEGRLLGLDFDQGQPKRGFKTEQGRAWYKI